MDSQRYDHVMMGDHVGQQQNLVNHMAELQKKAVGVLNHLQTIWTAHGSNADCRGCSSITMLPFLLSPFVGCWRCTMPG